MLSDRDPPQPQFQFGVMILQKKSFILQVTAFSAGPPGVYEHCYATLITTLLCKSPEKASPVALCECCVQNLMSLNFIAGYEPFPTKATMILLYPRMCQLMTI